MRWFAALALLAAAWIMTMGIQGLPAVGDPSSPPARHVSPRYIQEGKRETGAENLVTGVLADYRGFDTLGETTVIFTAGIACLLLLVFPKRREEES